MQRRRRREGLSVRRWRDPASRPTKAHGPWNTPPPCRQRSPLDTTTLDSSPVSLPKKPKGARMPHTLPRAYQATTTHAATLARYRTLLQLMCIGCFLSRASQHEPFSPNLDTSPTPATRDLGVPVCFCTALCPSNPCQTSSFLSCLYRTHRTCVCPWIGTHIHHRCLLS